MVIYFIQLKWSTTTNTGYQVAESPFGAYEVWESVFNGDAYFARENDPVGRCIKGDIEDAKKAAQEDFESLGKACIDWERMQYR